MVYLRHMVAFFVRNDQPLRQAVRCVPRVAGAVLVTARPVSVCAR